MCDICLSLCKGLVVLPVYTLIRHTPGTLWIVVVFLLLFLKHARIPCISGPLLLLNRRTLSAHAVPAAFNWRGWWNKRRGRQLNNGRVDRRGRSKWRRWGKIEWRWWWNDWRMLSLMGTHLLCSIIEYIYKWEGNGYNVVVVLLGLLICEKFVCLSLKNREREQECY